MLTRVTIVVERTLTCYSAYAPDVPGCGATGCSIDEVVAHMAEALISFLPFMYQAGDRLPVTPSDPAEVMPLAREDRVLDLMLPVPDLQPAALDEALVA